MQRDGEQTEPVKIIEESLILKKEEIESTRKIDAPETSKISNFDINQVEYVS